MLKRLEMMESNGEIKRRIDTLKEELEQLEKELEERPAAFEKLREFGLYPHTYEAFGDVPEQVCIKGFIGTIEVVANAHQEVFFRVEPVYKKDFTLDTRSAKFIGELDDETLLSLRDQLREFGSKWESEILDPLRIAYDYMCKKHPEQESKDKEGVE